MENELVTTESKLDPNDYPLVTRMLLAGCAELIAVCTSNGEVLYKKNYDAIQFTLAAIKMYEERIEPWDH